MNIPTVLLETLKCSKCGVYLSRSPVYLQHDSQALCGRCFAPELPASRNIHYETVAKLLRFPCKYKELGCGKTVPYVQEDEVIEHEEVCKFREWMCPVLGFVSCDWLGSKADMIKHCLERHGDLVVDNPCKLEHDISKFSEQTFLVRAFQVLFLLHAKVCVTSGKIYYSVRHLGDSDSASKFTFSVDIKRDECWISRPGDVAPQGCLAIHDASSLSLDINSLRSLLGRLTGASFTVEVKRRVHEAIGLCSRCGARGAVLVYRDEGGWRCERCAPARRACENKTQGCNHEDVEEKCTKHEMLFCQQRTECWLCHATLERDSLSAHYDSACEAVYRTASTWRARRTGLGGRWCLVSGAAGYSLCMYSLNHIELVLHVYTALPSERLCEFRCVVNVTQPGTELIRAYTPDVLYDEWFDWEVKVKKEEFVSWDKFDVCLYITKLET